MAPTNASNAYDGGWEDAVDSGDGIEEIVLGAVHPYDRHDHYTPAPRWGTRHELTSMPFADPIAQHEAGGDLQSTAGPSARNDLRRKPAGSTPSPPREQPQVPKAARAERIATSLGITVRELKLLRKAYADARFHSKAFPRAQRANVIARDMGLTHDQVDRYVHAEQQGGSSPIQPLRMRPLVDESKYRRPPRSLEEFVRRLRELGRTPNSIERPIDVALLSRTLKLPEEQFKVMLSLAQRVGRKGPAGGDRGSPTGSLGATKNRPKTLRAIPGASRGPSRRPISVRITPSVGCPSCGRPVSMNGQCGCS